MNITNIKYLSFDLDGTLLNEQGKISLYTKEIIKRLQEQGYIVILNSGRFYHELASFCEQLELAKYGGYAICSNGYMIYNAKTKEIHKQIGILPSEVIALLPIIKKHSLFLFLRHKDTYCAHAKGLWKICMRCAKAFTYISLPLSARLSRYRKHLQTTSMYSYDQRYFNEELEKLCFIGFPSSIQNIRNTILSQYDQYQFFDCNAYSTELVKKGVSKADTLRKLLQTLGGDLHQVIAFGDAENDIPLLTQAEIGVCMKNASIKIKQHTSIHSDYTNKEDGVAKFLNEVVLKGSNDERNRNQIKEKL